MNRAARSQTDPKRTGFVEGGVCQGCGFPHWIGWGASTRAFWPRHGRPVDWITESPHGCDLTVFTIYDAETKDPYPRNLYRWPENWAEIPGEEIA